MKTKVLKLILKNLKLALHVRNQLEISKNQQIKKLNDLSIGNPEDEDLMDDEGRFLLKKSDLMHKNNIAVNDLVPRTIVAQLDSKVGNWKTTYDIINDAPFKEEPQSKF